MKTLLLLCTFFFCVESTNVNMAKMPVYAQPCFDFVDPKYHELAYEVFTCHKLYPDKVNHALHCAQMLNNHTQLVYAATCFVYSRERNERMKY
ncbi:hypothetical protein ANCCAN_12976 [Ancylostoma caninum]|uniref:Uncharacterized protein n=1 Tax=Ancylostoma caninum TaxID=29170 RepID=A0A368GDI9_ANCCA|nr:hypothetical protein ANCCAN_12976 [Ancylostoma caninum]